MSAVHALAHLDAVAQAELVRRGDISCREVLEACAARAAAIDPLIHALTATDFDRARERAAQTPLGPFAGVPMLLKDLIAYPGLRWSMGSRLFAHNVGAEGSPFTARLDAAGLLTVGKTTTSEFGLLGSTETLLEGVTHNPWNLAYSASGSSGGAAAAVAAGVVPLAHASVGGGSIRIPASVCGLFGLMPRARRCVPTSAMATAFGALVAEHCVSRSVRDSALFLAVTEARGADAAYPPVGYVRAPSSQRLRIGTWTRTLMGTEPEPEVRAALDATVALCARLGHTVETLAPPPIEGPRLSEAFFTIAAATMAEMVERMTPVLGRPVRRDELEPFTWALIDDYRTRPGDALDQARRACATGARAYLAVFQQYDVILTPTLAVAPWRLGHLSPTQDYTELPRRTERAVGYTPIHNIAGCPAMSVPLSWSRDGLPIGTHFAAAPGCDAVLLGLAYELEAAAPWADRWAPYSFPKVFGDDATGA
jgi:amidase